MTFDEAAELIQKGGFKDFNYDMRSVSMMLATARRMADMSWLRILGEGWRQFIITKTGNNKYHIEAKYGSAEGGSFTQYQGDDAEMYGPSSAVLLNSE